MRARAAHYKGTISCLLLLLLLLIGGSCSASAFDRSHRLFTEDLEKYADGKGVHYEKWQRKPGRLARYLRSLADLSAQDYKGLSDADKEAFWLDLYEALQIKIILDHYPIHGTIDYYPADSLRQIPGVFDELSTKALGKNLTLYDIEHDYIRKEVKDVRVHFGLACGANGCCPTPRFAYTAANLDSDLSKAQTRFLADKKNLDIDRSGKTVYVSQIFKWFPLDFSFDAGFKTFPFPPPSDDDIILSYLALNGPDDVKEALKLKDDRSRYKVVYRPFDWTLNDADAR